MTNSTVEKFEKYLNTQHFSPRTISLYIKVVTDFLVGRDPLQITPEDLVKYHEHISTLEISYKSKNLKIIPLRSFFKFLQSHNLSTVHHLSLRIFKGKNDHKPLDLISRQELKTYLSFKESPQNDFIVNFLYSTGLRVAELCALKIEDVSAEFKIIGKGGRERTVFVDPETLALFEEYKRHIPPVQMSLLELTIRSVHRIVSERAKYLGMSKPVSPHTLRHLYATHLYENGADIMTLKELLGHSSVMTTQIYTHVNTERMKETYQKFKKMV